MPRSPTENRLRLVVRSGNDHLFVRMHPDTAAVVRAKADTSVINSTLALDRCWMLQKEDVDSFLPLELSLPGGHKVYCSYNGGELPEKNVIQVPRSLLSKVPDLPQMVSVQAVPYIPYCAKVQVDPASVNDWELLQVHAEELEKGAILNQVSVVYPGQNLTLRLKQDNIHVAIQEMSMTEDSPWPTEENDDSPLGMLIQDTEVVVAPKPRVTSSTSSSWSKPLQVIPSNGDWSDRMRDLIQSRHGNTLDVPPGCILVNPSIWDPQLRWARLAASDEDEQDAKLVCVKTSKLVGEHQAVLHPWLRWDLGLPLHLGSVRIQMTREPRVLPLDNVVFQRIQVESARIASWRQPDLRSVIDEMDLLGDSPNPSEWVLPIGSVGAVPSEFCEGPMKSYFRIESDADSADDVVVVRHADLKSILLAGEDEADDEILTTPETDSMLSCVPDMTFPSTIECLESPYLADMESNSSTLFLLHGASGSGKTHFASVLAAMATVEQNRPMLYLDCKRLQESTTGIADILAAIDAVFEEIRDAQSALLVLDDLDRLAPNLLGGDEGDPGAKVHSANPTAIDQSKLIADRVLQLSESAGRHCSNLSLVVTCPSPTALNSSLLEANSSFQRTVSVPTLTAKQRIELIFQMVGHSSPASGDKEETIGQQTESCRPRDLEKIASRAQRLLASNGQKMAAGKAVEEVLASYTPLSHLALDRPQETSQLTWSEIGGLFDVKSKLEATILHPAKYRSIYQEAKIRLPRGVLLFGSPGCGKSAIVPALAKLCQMPLISCKGPEVLDRYIGASEAKVRELFNRAQAVAPSILFLDELDALAPRRGSDNTGVTDRVVNQLLTFLDGVEDTSAAPVYVIGATSRPDKVDPALLRPGRLEKHLFVGPPASDDEWVDLFASAARFWSLSKECSTFLSDKSNVEELLASISNKARFTPADIKAALDTAHLSAVHRLLETTTPEDIDHVEIEIADLRVALGTTKPCLNADDAMTLDEIYHRYGKSGNKAAAKDPKDAQLKTSLR